MTIKRKVTLWYAFMLILIVFLLFAFLLPVSGSIFRRESNSRLEYAVLDFIDEIDFEEDGSYEWDDDIRFYEDGVIFSVYDEQGRLLEGSVPADFPADTTLKSLRFQEISAAGSTWSVYDAAVPYGNGRLLWIRGIFSGQGFFSVERGFFLALLIACPLLIVTALLVGYSITRRAFLPMEEIQKTAEEIGAGRDLSARIPTSRTQGELRQLADTFNRMLARLEASFDHERQFTADASHELRTPISVITSQAEYALLPDATPEEQREGLQIILEQARRMGSLISQLLFLARSDSGKGQLQMSPVNFSALCSAAAEQCRAAAASSHIRVETAIQPNLFLLGDESALLRLLLNLLENAVQYGREGGCIRLELTEDQEDVLCRISDDGIGIPPEHLDKIWKRFYRADPSRTSNGSNSGLGLSLVRHIAEAHGGRMQAESEPGAGSTFTFRCRKLRQSE